jgi:hypothetical protein
MVTEALAGSAIGRKEIAWNLIVRDSILATRGPVGAFWTFLDLNDQAFAIRNICIP